jgi:hypothetical protein
VWDDLDLQPGERVVGIDGEPVPSDLVDFYTTSGGPRGEVIVLQVEGDDGPRDVEVSLKVLGFDDWLIND